MFSRLCILLIVYQFGANSGDPRATGAGWEDDESDEEGGGGAQCPQQ